jgi:predicted nucleic acid-binding protein
MEVAAIKNIVKICVAAGFTMIGSFATVFEINKIRRPEKLEKVLGYYRSTITESVTPTPDIDIRARALQAQGLKSMDSYHLACAEAALADFLLTTDIRFVNAYDRLNFSFVKVMNPITFLPEVEKWAQ